MSQENLHLTADSKENFTGASRCAKDLALLRSKA
jgi:hypothetical protein